MILLQIQAPHFTAGIEIGGRVAPIIKYMHGWTVDSIYKYCNTKGWSVVKISD